MTSPRLRASAHVRLCCPTCNAAPLWCPACGGKHIIRTQRAPRFPLIQRLRCRCGVVVTTLLLGYQAADETPPAQAPCIARALRAQPPGRAPLSAWAAGCGLPELAAPGAHARVAAGYRRAFGRPPAGPRRGPRVYGRIELVEALRAAGLSELAERVIAPGWVPPGGGAA